MQYLLLHTVPPPSFFPNSTSFSLIPLTGLLFLRHSIATISRHLPLGSHRTITITTSSTPNQLTLSLTIASCIYRILLCPSKLSFNNDTLYPQSYIQWGILTFLLAPPTLMLTTTLSERQRCCPCPLTPVFHKWFHLRPHLQAGQPPAHSPCCRQPCVPSTSFLLLHQPW